MIDELSRIAADATKIILEKYEGVLGHYHIQTNKTDPGPALDWDKVIGEARELMAEAQGGANDTSRGHMRRRF